MISRSISSTCVHPHYTSSVAFRTSTRKNSLVKIVVGGLKMNHVVVIRDYRPGDEFFCRDVLKEGAMSTLNISFLAGLTREATFQVIVLSAAIMFIFFGVPFSFCFGVIPVVIILMYISIWLGHTYKALEITQEVLNIPRAYMSSEYTGFWVAEVFEPYYMMREPSEIRYKILTERDININHADLQSHQKKVIGTIAITRSRSNENIAWIRRMAVHSKYQRKGIASALVDEALRFCALKGYQSVELVTSECHNDARELFLKKDFELKQMYHKHIIGKIVSILMYELVFTLKPNKVPVSP